MLFFAGVTTGVVATALAARIISRRRSGRLAASLSQLAHDLRTPLCSVTAYTEILRDDKEIEQAERSRFLGIIHEEAGRMETMIENRLGGGRPADDGPQVRQRTAAPGAASRTILVEATRTLLKREGFVALGASGGEQALAQALARHPDLILMDLGMPGMTGEETLRHLREDAATREIPVIITTGDDAAPALKGAAAILTAEDGEAALRVARAEKPGLVLLDLNMPIKSGYQVCEEIKSDPELKGTHVIMVTARGQDSDRARGVAAGADEYITKPFSPRSLRARLLEILGAP